MAYIDMAYVDMAYIDMAYIDNGQYNYGMCPGDPQWLLTDYPGGL